MYKIHYDCLPSKQNEQKRIKERERERETEEKERKKEKGTTKYLETEKNKFNGL